MKRSEDAVEAFRRPRQLVLGCVSPAVLVVRTTGVGGGQRLLSPVPETAALPLAGRRTHGLFVEIVFVAVFESDVAGWVARETGYRYAVLEPDGRELFAYHRHPHGNSAVRYPHLHVAGRDDSVTRKMHLPTGHVSLAAVVRCLIADLGVVPLRPDWRRMLERASESAGGEG